MGELSLSRSLQEVNMARATVPEDLASLHAYAFVRFKSDYIQTMRNSILSQAPFTTNCRGKVLGIGRDVDVYDGQWSRGTYILVMFFETVKEAVMWFQCAPEAKQPDWIHPEIEVAVVPLQGPPSHKPYINLVSSFFRAGNLPAVQQWLREHGKETAEKMRGDGAEGFVAATERTIHPKGYNYLGHVFVHQWDCPEKFKEWFNRDDIKRERDASRQLTMERDIVFFGLEPLVQETEYSKAVKDADKGFLW